MWGPARGGVGKEERSPLLWASREPKSCKSTPVGLVPRLEGTLGPGSGPGIWRAPRNHTSFPLSLLLGYQSALEAGAKSSVILWRAAGLQSSHSHELCGSGVGLRIRKGFDFLWCQVLREASSEGDCYKEKCPGQASGEFFLVLAQSVSHFAV